MDLDSRIQKLKGEIEKDDIKYPVTKFDPKSTFVDASLFPEGLTKTDFERIKSKVVKRDMDKIHRSNITRQKNKRNIEKKQKEDDKYKKLERNLAISEKLDPIKKDIKEEKEQNEKLEKHKSVAMDKILDTLQEKRKDFKDCIENNKDKEGFVDFEKCLRELRSLISNDPETPDNKFISFSIDIIHNIFNSNHIEAIKQFVTMWRETQTQLLGGKRKRKSRKTNRGGKRKKKSKKTKRGGKQGRKKKVKKVVKKKKSKKKKSKKKKR